MNKAFNLAAKLGIASFVILIAMGICVGALDYAVGPKSGSKWQVVPQVVGFFAALVLLVSTLLVWVEGWVFIAEGMKSRLGLMTLLLVLALLFFNILAAYVFHFVRKSRLMTPATTLKATV